MFTVQLKLSSHIIDFLINNKCIVIVIKSENCQSQVLKTSKALLSLTNSPNPKIFKLKLYKSEKSSKYCHCYLINWLKQLIDHQNCYRFTFYWSIVFLYMHKIPIFCLLFLSSFVSIDLIQPFKCAETPQVMLHYK